MMTFRRPKLTERVRVRITLAEQATIEREAARAGCDMVDIVRAALDAWLSDPARARGRRARKSGYNPNPDEARPLFINLNASVRERELMTTEADRMTVAREHTAVPVTLSELVREAVADFMARGIAERNRWIDGTN